MSIRKITELTINDFLLKLSYETWDNVFSAENVNAMFQFVLRLLFENFLFQLSFKESPHLK
jgi:hypothetical protein